jgi:UDP-3-O-[3-hydroxymyristoyl] glucosamine N-acyltransferase
MEFSAAQIAGLLQGKIEGNTEAKVNTFAKIEEGKPGALSFLANPKYNHYLYECKSSVIIVSDKLALEKPVASTLIRVEDPYSSFAELLSHYEAFKKPPVGISSKASVHETAKVGADVFIGDHVVIGANVEVGNNAQIYANTVVEQNSKIGSHTTLRSNVTVYNDCIIGAHCTIHSGVIVGADGFGFAPNADNNYKKVPQIGNVIIEDHVEIGANTTIDRATMGSTIIRKGVKLDNLIQVGHNVEIGENTVIAALTGIAGSCKIGKNCMIGGQVGLAGHLSIADGTKMGAKSGIAHTVSEPNQTLIGAPAVDYKLFRKMVILWQKLPEMFDSLKVLQKDVQDLKNKE